MTDRDGSTSPADGAPDASVPADDVPDDSAPADDAPDGFAPAVDAHVHLLPARLQRAIREALHAETGWDIDGPTDRERMEAELRAHGVERYVALPYAHREGVARELNEWVLGQAAESEMAVPFATVHGDDDVGAVVREAFEAGARGLKFQCPVQECGPADPRLDPAFEACAEYDRPVVFHAGTAPTFRDSPHVGADQFESFLASYPSVRACAAHMGAYDVDAFLSLAETYENAYLDTTVTLSAAVNDLLNFDPVSIPDAAIERLSEYVMYGTDYPNVPYDYAEERRGILARDLSMDARRDVFYRTAHRFLGE